MQWNAHLDLEILSFKSCWALTINCFFLLLVTCRQSQFFGKYKINTALASSNGCPALFSSLFQWKLLISMCADTSYTRYFPCTTLKGFYT